MPNLHVIRPADNREVKMAWIAALRYRGPTALILSRQNLPELAGCNVPYDQGMAKGAYIVKKERQSPIYALWPQVPRSLWHSMSPPLWKRLGKAVRVISMPCWELFEEQSDEYKRSIVGGDLGRRVSIEAGVSFGWSKWIGPEGIAISIETYGESAPQSDLAAEFGFTVDSILDRLLK